MPLSLMLPAFTAARKRCRQRNEVLPATPQRAAAPSTVSPSPSPSANAAHSSFLRSRASGVPVKALKVLPQPLQQYRLSPFERPRITAPSVLQCGQRRASSIRASSSATTAANDAGAASTSTASSRCRGDNPSASASQA